MTLRPRSEGQHTRASHDMAWGKAASFGSCVTPCRLMLVAMVVMLTSTLALSARRERSRSFPYGHTTSSTSTSNPFQLDSFQHSSRNATTLVHRWRITSDERRPDGVLKQVFLVNDQFPGPIIEARSGDRIIVEMENALYERNESISIHWHGLTMHGCNDMDGTAGITQDLVPVGQKFTYDFTIADDQFGTFWYHAHSAVQRADGLYGGLIVHEPQKQPTNELQQPNEYLLMISDWYHRPADEVLASYLTADSFGTEPVPDSILINGKGTYNCGDAVPARPVDCQAVQQRLPSLHFDASKSSTLRIINVGAYSGLSLAMTGAHLRVITVDGGNPVKSNVSDTIGLLYPGERFNVYLNDWTDVESDFTITLPAARFRYSNPALRSSQSFEMSLENQQVTLPPTMTPKPDDIVLQQLKPTSLTPAIPTANTILLLYTMTERLAHLDYVPHGNINRTSWTPHSPHLLSTSRKDWPKDQLVPHIPYNASQPLWVDLVVNNLDEEDHPFHLHGHDFYIMSTFSSTTNWGSYNPFDIFDPPGGAYTTQPLKKDTVTVPRRGYAVLRFQANNPGIWMFHCHVIWHLASGMAMGIDVS